MTELSVIKLMLKRDNFLRYYTPVSRIRTEPEIHKILTCINTYYDTYTHHEYISVDELCAYIYVQYPSEKNNAVLKQLLDRLRTLEVSDSVAAGVVAQLLEKDAAADVVQLLMPILSGEKSGLLLQVPEIVADFKDKLELVDDEEDHYITDSLSDLVELIDNRGGARWSLQYLNENIGPLPGCTLGHIFARVECGKTSFVASQVAAWLTQVADGQVLWVCNEEHGRFVRLRAYETILNLTKGQIHEALTAGKRDELEAMFAKAGGNNLRIHYDANVSVEQIRALLEKLERPRFLIVDVADHVGFRGDVDLTGPARLGELYRKYRSMAAHYGMDILTVGQASAECDGNKILHLNHMHNSRTDKPGALDYAIGIGKTYNEEDSELRWLTVCKNKIGTTIRETQVVGFDRERGRYYDV